MKVSKLLGATMVAGALGAGAVTGIATAAGNSGSSSAGTTGSTPSTTTPGAQTTTTPSPSPPSKTTPKTQTTPPHSKSGHPCPNMGSHSGSSGEAAPRSGAGASYPGSAPEVSYQ
jgi:hypothetical protein